MEILKVRHGIRCFRAGHMADAETEHGGFVVSEGEEIDEGANSGTCTITASSDSSWASMDPMSVMHRAAKMIVPNMIFLLIKNDCVWLYR